MRDPTAETVGTVMTEGIRTVTPELTIDELVKIFVDENLNRVLVLNPDRKPVGVISRSDVLLHQHLRGGATASAPPAALSSPGVSLPQDWGFDYTSKQEAMGEVMAGAVVSISDEATLTEACELMIRSRVHGLPVISRTRGPVGWVSATDVVSRIARAAR